MPPQLVYTGVEGHVAVKGQLFAGKKFFLSQRLPQRSSFIKDIQANGGLVVRLEQQADHLIADHLRSDAPPASLSYTFIEQAIKAGHLPPEDDHRAGPIRPAARATASSAPTRVTRTPFTAQDDQDLYAWVKHAEAQGVAVKGLELYRQLEAKNPRHTYQSWRERYIKHLIYKPPTALPTPPSERLAAPPVTTDAAPMLEAQVPSSSGKTTARRTGVSKRPTKSATPSVPTAANALPDRPSATSPTPQLQNIENEPTKQHVTEVDTTPQEPGTPILADTTKQDTPEAVVKPNEHLEVDMTPQQPGTPILAGTAKQDATEAVIKPIEHPLVDMTPQEPGTPILVDTAAPSLPDDPHIPSIQHDPSPSMPGFEDEDIQEWVAAADVIQDLPFRRYRKAWMDYSEKHPKHTAREWRDFYEHIILPIYEEREANQPSTEQASMSLPNDAAPKSVLASPRQTGEPVNTSSKRKLEDPDALLDQSRKQQHLDEPSTWSDPLQEAPVHTKAATFQQSSHVTISSDASSEHVEDMQSLPGRVMEATEDSHSTSRVSDVDTLVQHQLLQEMELSSRVPLTAKNLAKIQAEHSSLPDKRALDIAPDDEHKDQGDFAGYLATLLQAPAAGAPMSKDATDELLRKRDHLETLAENIDHDEDEDEDEDVTLVPQHHIVHGASSSKIAGSGVLHSVVANPDSSPVRSRSPLYQPAPLDPDLSPPISPAKIDDMDPALPVDYNDDDSQDDIQLELCEPEGGWSAFSSQSHTSLPHQSLYAEDTVTVTPQKAKPHGNPKSSYTQGIFAIETQEPDLDIPDLDMDSQADHLEPAMDSQAMSEEQVQAFLFSMEKAGYVEEDITFALIRTCMRSDLARIVLESLAHDHKVPDDIPGIWTEEDDGWLEGKDSRKVRLLEQKHGWPECELRLTFLEEMRE